MRRNAVTEHYRISFLSVSCEVFRGITASTRRKNSYLIHFSSPQALEVSTTLCSEFRYFVFTHFFSMSPTSRKERHFGSAICSPSLLLLPDHSQLSQALYYVKWGTLFSMTYTHTPYTVPDRCVQTYHGYTRHYTGPHHSALMLHSIHMPLYRSSPFRSHVTRYTHAVIQILTIPFSKYTA